MPFSRHGLVRRGEAELKRFEILGPVRAFDGDDEIALGPVKQRAVLAVLLLNANRPVSASQIVTAVWQDEPPGNGANVVQKYVAGLRRALEPERTLRAPWQLLTLTEAGYMLSIEPGALDADVFRDRVRQALAAREAGQLVRAAAELQAALALWRADPLAGLTGAVFDAARDRLSESRAAALESWAETELMLGRHATLVPELVRLIAEYPLREQLRHHLMLALYRTGRQAEALAAYRDARAFFVEEFGAEPGEPLQQLHQRILRSDPTLAAPVDSPAPAAPVSPPPVSPPPGAPPTPPSMPSPAMLPPLRLPPDRPSRWWAWVWLVGAIVLTFGTCGYLSWLVVGVYALRRRSWPNALAAAGYLLLAVVSLVALFTDPNLDDPDAELSEAHGWAWFLAAFVVWSASTVHAAIIGALTVKRARDADPHRAARREQALQIVRWRPDLARELLIGRPDLPRQFDDGGLVDINAVPEHVIAMLPGVTTYLTQMIVADRALHGPYASVEHMVARQVITPKLADSLRGLLIFGRLPDREGRPQAGDVQHA
ncbi:BTAD domain-containing putative transcriptional regulator [Phytohabitans sp. LJ34]|uniref:BTAD domain-containing putative transcriptional regulator n=1 Tax=Phytohabitans sp. LJ34 TaxID=3452217 RepID=UPI003F8C045A